MRACFRRLDWRWLGLRREGLILNQSQLAGSDGGVGASVQGVMGRRIADATGKTKMRANGVVRSTKAALRFVTQPSRTNRRYSAVVTRQSLLGGPGPGLILATGTGEPIPASWCSLATLRSCEKSWFAKKARAGSGGKAFTCTSATTRVVPLSGSSSGESGVTGFAPITRAFQQNLPDSRT